MGGLGSGRRPLSLAELKARGTFRPSRHAKLLPRPVDRDERFFGPDADDERQGPRRPEISAAERRRTLAGLGPDGQAFVRAMLAQLQDWLPHELRLLRRTACVLDRLADLERSGNDAKTAAAVRAETRVLLACVKALRVAP